MSKKVVGIKNLSTGEQMKFNPKVNRSKLQKFGDASGKVLNFASKPLQSAIELAAPAAEGTAIAGSYLQGDIGKKYRQDRLSGESYSDLKTPKQVAGKAVETFAEIAPFVSGGLGSTLTGKGKGLMGFANSFTGRSAELAFARTVGEDLQKDDKSAYEILKDASIKGIIAGASSYTLGRMFQGITKFYGRRATKLAGRTYSIPPEMIENSIKYDTKGANAKLAEAGFMGSKKQIIKHTLAEKTQVGEEVYKRLERKDAIVKKISKELGRPVGMIRKSDVTKDFQDLIKNTLFLDKDVLKTINEKAATLPDTFGFVEANNFKRYFANQVPKAAWRKGADKITLDEAQVSKALSAGFRKEIDRLVPGVKKLNEKWAVANDAWNLLGKAKSIQDVVGGVGDEIAHGLWASIARVGKAPFVNTPVRTFRMKSMQTYANMNKKQLLKEILKFTKLKVDEAID